MRLAVVSNEARPIEPTAEPWTWAYYATELANGRTLADAEPNFQTSGDRYRGQVTDIRVNHTR